MGSVVATGSEADAAGSSEIQPGLESVAPLLPKSVVGVGEGGDHGSVGGVGVGSVGGVACIGSAGGQEGVVVGVLGKGVGSNGVAVGQAEDAELGVTPLVGLSGGESAGGTFGLLGKFGLF